ncbi:MAG: hypothetical protein WAS56_03295, partial [Saprospiraceae bacterium]
IHLLLVSQSKGLLFSFVCHIISLHLLLFSQSRYFADAEIIQTNIMSSEVKQQFTNDSTGELKQFDYAVTNSPSLIKY